MSPADTERANPGPKDIAVIVTGAARGMGRAMTHGLAAAGVRVVAADLPSSHNEMAEVLDTALKQGGQNRIAPIDCDVTQWRDCTNAAKSAIDRFGAVHGLVNNAAVGMQGFGHVQVGPRAKLYEHDVDAWRRAIDANVNGPVMMAKGDGPELVRHG